MLRWIASIVLICNGLLLIAVTPAAGQADEDRRAHAGQLVRQLSGHFEELAVLRDAIEAQTFNPQSVIDNAGEDPAALFTFVRDQTRPIPYRGTLRGPVGVLMDRQGNALDRSLLLAELLRQAGHSVRLARGELDAQTAQTLAAEAKEGLKAQNAAALEDRDDHKANEEERLTAVSERLGRSVDDLRTQAAAQSLAAEKQAETLAFATVRQTDALTRLLGERVQPEATDPFNPEAFTDHWWVLLEQDGDWIPLDPSRSDHQVGDALIDEPTATFDAPIAYDQLPANLPDEVKHLLRIEVVAVRWENNELAEETALTADIALAEEVLRPLRIGFTPLPTSGSSLLDAAAQEENDAPAPGQVRERLTQTLTARREWAPTLLIGDDATTQASIRADGTLNLNPVFQSNLTGERLNEAADALRDLGAGKEAEPAPADTSHLVGVHLRYTLLAPGTEPVVVTRPMLDLLGATNDPSAFDPTATDAHALARGVALSGRISLLPQVAQPTPEVVAYIGINQALSNRKPLLEVAYGAALQDREHLTAGFRQIESRPMRLYQALLMRHQQLGDAPLAVTSANLISDVTLADWHDDAPEGLVLLNGIDWLHNALTPLDADANRREAMVRQGVSDTLSESIALLGLDLATDAEGDRVVSHNAAVAFGQAIAAGQADWQVAGDISEVDQMANDWPAPAKRALARDVERGFLVVFPSSVASGAAPAEAHAHHATVASAPPPVWWRIDPATGTTLGMSLGPRGMTGATLVARGQAMAERLSIMNHHFQLMGDVEAIIGLLKGIKECGQKPPDQQGCCMLSLAWTNALGVAAGNAGGAVGLGGMLNYAWGKAFGELTKGLDMCVLNQL